MDVFTGKRKKIGSFLGTGEQNLLCLEIGVWSLTQGSVQERIFKWTQSLCLKVINCMNQKDTTATYYFILTRYTGESGRTVFE